MKRRLLFVSNLLTDFSNYEPLGILYLSSSLKKHGHTTYFSNATWGEALTALKEFKPHIIAYSITTGMHKELLELNRKLKKVSSFFALFGGPHTTFFPETIQKEGVDGICIGEGEEAIVDLANRMEKEEEINTIENLWIKQDGEIYRNPVRNLVEDLDAIPFPDRELIYDRFKSSRDSKIKFFISNRGCPFKCTYCFNHYFHEMYKGKGKIVRIRSVDNVLQEIAQIQQKYALGFLKFVNDIFFFRDEWIREFAEKYPRQIGLPFYCIVRANMVTPERVSYLKKAGCHSVAMGVESGNERIRNEVLRRKMGSETIIEACKMIKSGGLRIFTQNMIGLPSETLENAFETLELNKICKPDYAWVSLYSPYPNTILGEKAKDMGLFDGNIDSFSITYHLGSPMQLPNKKELENLQKLFALAVEFPCVARYIKSLIRLPLKIFYELVRKIWKGYAFKFRIYPVKLKFGEFVKLTVQFLLTKGG